MKILHTSDWHLGRSFHGASLLDEQEEALDRIVAIARDEQVELVIVAGDLYDRAIAPAPAVDLLGRTLSRLHDLGAAVAAISGNHDSAVRVGGNDALLNRMGVALRGDPGRVAEPLILEQPLDGGPPVVVYLVPYLEPAAVGRLLPATSPSTSDDRGVGDAAEVADAGRATRPDQRSVVEAALSTIRADLSTRPRARSVVVAHTFVAGGTTSESERDLSVGNVDQVPVSVFEGFDLVALGHLHSPQVLDGDRLSYSGSPLPYSFSEEGRAKSVRVVEMAVDGSLRADTVPLGVGRGVRTLVGAFDDLLSDSGFVDAEGSWVRVRLTDPDLPDQAMARLRTRFPHALELRHEPGGVAPVANDSVVALEDLRRLEPLELALRFWDEQEGAPADEEVRELLGRAIDAARSGSER